MDIYLLRQLRAVADGDPFTGVGGEQIGTRLEKLRFAILGRENLSGLANEI